ncbi:hypothetical protein MTO96_039889 [Rhipicephalus appendiculatus]
MADSGAEGTRSGDGHLERVLAALLCLRTRRRHAYIMLEGEIDREAEISRDIEQRLLGSSFTVAAVLADSAPSLCRSVWSFQRNERWFEDTLPHLTEFHFNQALRVTPSTFRYLVESLACDLNRLSTEMRAAVSVEKRVAIGLYRLCSSAEDRTIAHLFGVGRSTVNVVWRQFSTAVIEQLESQWICMVWREDMADHVREFFVVTGFPQAVGALDDCLFPVSPLKKHATDYYNYKGW